jgi:predicted Na+-dependent transporter
VNNRVVRVTLITVGVVALIVGAVFMGQGLGLIPGSFMTGDRTWLAIGLIIAVVGVILLVLGVRRPGPKRRDGES